MRRYVTTHQYEPLQAPSGWGEEERRLIRRLTEIFDDIYRRYGRLGLEDVSRAFGEALDSLRERVREADQKAEEARNAAEESFAAANNASGMAYEARLRTGWLEENRYRTGDCLVTGNEESPEGRLAGEWEAVGSGSFGDGTERLYVWRRVE